MEKQVYCLIHPRRKLMKFTSKKNETDAAILRKLLEAACKTDQILSIMLKDKAIIFQVKDELGGWCDMDEDEQIPTKSEINVLLISLPKIETATYFDPNKLQAGEKVELDVKVVYAEPANDPVNDLNIPPSAELLPLTSSESQAHADNSIDDIISEEDDNKKDEEPIKVKKEVKKCLKTLTKSHKLSVLPELSFDLKNKLEKQGVLRAQHHLIRFWGQYLLQETNEQPSRQDYYNLASTIVAAYPELRGGTNGNGIVRTQLSTWIRNYRSSDKKSCKRKKQVSDDGAECSTTACKKIAIANKSTALEKFTESDISRANEELKKFTDGKNVQHYKRLLLVTKPSRRPWIENESISIPDIIERFPPLAYCEMIIHECINVILSTDEKTVFEDVNKMLDELFNYYTNEENDDYIGFKETSDKNKSTVVDEVCKVLLPKRLKKTASYPLWEINEIMDSLDCLNSAQGAAPRAVLFINEEEETIEQAFIIADENVQVEVSEPTTAKILTVLLSAYYTWHRSFPTAYTNALDFFAFKIFRIECKKNNAVAKFLRRLDNFQVNLKSKENIDSNISK